jgi:hypothetical protein
MWLKSLYGSYSIAIVYNLEHPFDVHEGSAFEPTLAPFCARDPHSLAAAGGSSDLGMKFIEGIKWFPAMFYPL